MRGFLFLVVAVVIGSSGFASAELPADQVAFFENKIRPVLVEHCFACHSADASEVGGRLLLDSANSLTSGGESGSPVVAGKPAESLIVQAIKYDGLEMPPDGPLPETVIRDFETWIARGAVFPAAKKTPDAAPATTDQTTHLAANLWSLKPITNPAPPVVEDQQWSRGEIDRFILAQIEAADLRPASDATPEELIRRLYFDLIGLPPEYEAVKQFVALYERDNELALANLVDDLLSRPQFGERWGRYWLDVARYAESNGNDGLGRNPTFPHAWRYRDYVISAFNEDKPFDQFVMEQIAGDLMPYESDEEYDSQRIATGLLAMSAKPAKAMNDNFDMDVVADQIDVVTRGFMGLSVACARCHDHKFDPVPTRDYYAMAGFFTSSETMWGLAGNENLTAPPTDLFVLKAANHQLPPSDFVETAILTESDTGKPKAIPKPRWKPGTPLAMGIRAKRPVACKLNIKGESKKLGDDVPIGFLTAFEMLDSDDASGGTTPNRMHLAEWITDPANPLTARVYANRIWQHLFSVGLVATPNDFGVYGQRPTHPLLLDHLATRLQQTGWSTKALIREIVLSRVYRLTSRASLELTTADPGNALLTRHRQRRLDAETFRDALLAATGQLDLSPGEGSLVRHRDILVNIAGDLHEPSVKRSVYLCYLRNSPPPELAAFNLPDFLATNGRRDESTLPAQALFLMNSDFLREQSAALAHRIVESHSTSEERIDSLFQATVSRAPGPFEREQAEALLASFNVDTNDDNLHNWIALCQAMLTTNEFRYVD